MSSKRITINKILSNESLVQENLYFQVRGCRASRRPSVHLTGCAENRPPGARGLGPARTSTRRPRPALLAPVLRTEGGPHVASPSRDWKQTGDQGREEARSATEGWG